MSYTSFDDAIAMLSCESDSKISQSLTTKHLFDIFTELYQNDIKFLKQEQIYLLKKRCDEVDKLTSCLKREWIITAFEKDNFGRLYLYTLASELCIGYLPKGGVVGDENNNPIDGMRYPKLAKAYIAIWGTSDVEELREIQKKSLSELGRDIVFCGVCSPEQFNLIKENVNKTHDLSNIMRLKSLTIMKKVFSCFNEQCELFFNQSCGSITEKTVDLLLDYHNAGWDLRELMPLIHNDFVSKSLFAAMRKRCDISWFLRNRNFLMSNTKPAIKKAKAAVKLLNIGVNPHLLLTETIDTECALNNIVSSVLSGKPFTKELVEELSYPTIEELVEWKRQGLVKSRAFHGDEAVIEHMLKSFRESYENESLRDDELWEAI